MYQNDALLQHTSEATRQIMAAVVAQPQAARAAIIQSALDQIRPGLFAKVDRMAANVVAHGGTPLAAYAEAMRLALADEVVTSVRALGRTKQTGVVTDDTMRAQRLFYSDNGTSGFGDSGDGLGSVASDIAKFGENLLRSAACSPAVSTAIMNQVDSQAARDATAAGLSVAAGISRCAALTGQAPVTPPPVAPAPAPAPDNTMTYVAVGAAVLGLGAIALIALRRPKVAVSLSANRSRRRRK